MDRLRSRDCTEKVRPRACITRGVSLSAAVMAEYKDKGS